MKVDVTVIGSGFAGSILAWILAARGRSVVLLDRAKHPRFAIGESSTPIADTILKRLGETYRLKPLEDLSCWGTWRGSHPELPCGRKRGFSYLVHDSGQRFQETAVGEKSLLVAASPTDFQSDTHWYRSTLDEYLWSQAVKAGVVDRTGCEIIDIRPCQVGNRDKEESYLIRYAAGEKVLSQTQKKRSIEDVFELKTDWIVDASGSSASLSKFFSVHDRTHQLKTRTHAWFGHFEGVKPWVEVVDASRQLDFENPFSVDDAAQHHLLSDGWMWMLRFNHGVTSVGYTAPTDTPLVGLDVLVKRYPMIGDMMGSAECVTPDSGIVQTKRLQRWLEPVAAFRCVMLPTASLTLDPLHSTGIAHALAGVERLATVILDAKDQTIELARYSEVFMHEARFLDRVVQMAYRNLSRFDRFTIACMVYFAAAIRCEETYQAGMTPSHLWNAGDESFCEFVNWVDSVLDQADAVIVEKIRDRMQRWNSAGLMDPDVGNRFAYTATK